MQQECREKDGGFGEALDLVEHPVRVFGLVEEIEAGGSEKFSGKIVIGCMPCLLQNDEGLCNRDKARVSGV